MKKKKKIIIAVSAIVTVVLAGATTFAILSVVAPKNKGSKPNVSSEEAKKNAAKEEANKAESEARDLLDKIQDKGNTRESYKLMDMAVKKFNEASEKYEDSGSKHDSLQAKANADTLAHQLKVHKKQYEKLEAQHKKQQSEQEAARKAMDLNP